MATATAGFTPAPPTATSNRPDHSGQRGRGLPGLATGILCLRSADDQAPSGRGLTGRKVKDAGRCPGRGLSPHCSTRARRRPRSQGRAPGGATGRTPVHLLSFHSRGSKPEQQSCSGRFLCEYLTGGPMKAERNAHICAGWSWYLHTVLLIYIIVCISSSLLFAPRVCLSAI